MDIEQFMTDVLPRADERRNRIRLSVAAYAYEFDSNSIMSDGDFDELAMKINPELSTVEDYYMAEGRKRTEALDKFFREEFQPDTGQWIHKHPELEKIKAIYEKHYK
jgi:hypothetical protein